MDVRFDSETFSAPQHVSVRKDLLERIISFGIVKNRTEAQYLLLGVVVIAVIASIFLLGSGGSDLNPNPEAVPDVARPGARI